MPRYLTFFLYTSRVTSNQVLTSLLNQAIFLTSSIVYVATFERVQCSRALIAVLAPFPDSRSLISAQGPVEVSSGTVCRCGV